MAERITTVIFDFGGVLGYSRSLEDKQAIAALCGLTPEAFGAAYGNRRLELDRGALSTAEYWSAILKEGGIRPTPGLLARINDLDTKSWTRMNEGMMGWARLLRKKGFKTAVLSNMPPDKTAFLRTDPRFSWLSEFGAAVFSSEVDMVKPDPGIYRLCVEKLGVRPAECLFLDDHMVNVDAAVSLGMAGVLFDSMAGLAQSLSRWPEVPADGL